MPGIVLHKLHAVYWPIPKCACTTVKAHIARILGLPTTTPHHPHDAPFEWTEDAIDGYTNLAFVRHPLSRLHSLWLNKLAPGHPEAPHFRDGIDMNVFSRHLDKVRSGMSFAEFVRALPSMGGGDMDPHWALQITQIPNQCMLFRLERVHVIFDLLGIERLNVSPRDDWKSAYDPETFRRAVELYSPDFRRLGYQPETDIFIQ